VHPGPLASREGVALLSRLLGAGSRTQ
jgi:hypothetical protein